MTNTAHREDLLAGDADSFFPPDEAATFCSRPTPVVPAAESLRLLSAAAEATGPTGSPTTQPAPIFEAAKPAAIAQNDVITARPGAPKTESIRPSTDGLEQNFYASAPSGLAPSLPSSLPPPKRQATSRPRTVLSLLLFVTLFGGATALLGVAALSKARQSGGVANSLSALVGHTR